MTLKRVLSIGIGLLATALAACTVQRIEEGMYETFYQRQCLLELAMRNCDPDHRNYEDYKKEREALMRRNNSNVESDAGE
jgi:hypothetical protein